MELEYVGDSIDSESGDKALVYRDYIDHVKSGDISEDRVIEIIEEDLEGYALIADVDAADGFLADKDYVDSHDEERISRTDKNVPGGVPGLDEAGRVDPLKIWATDVEQQWNTGPFSPAQFLPQPPDWVYVTSGEEVLYSCDIADPGYPYKLVVTGMADVCTLNDGDWPTIRVKVAANNEVIARGSGLPDMMSAPTAGVGDDFETPHPADLGPGWDPIYYEDHGPNFKYVVGQGQAYWGGPLIPADNGAASMRAQRIDPLDHHTVTDYQKITLQVGGTWGQEALDHTETAQQYLRIYARMNDAGDEYCYFQIPDYPALYPVTAEHPVKFFYRDGEASEAGTLLAEQYGGWGQYGANKFEMYAGKVSETPDSDDVYIYQLYRDGQLAMTYTDSSHAIPVGVNNRGWGWGGRAGSRGIGQTFPPSVDYITINEAVKNLGTVTFIPCALDAMTTLTGPTTLQVTVSGSWPAGRIGVSPDYPQFHAVAIPVP